MMKVVVSLNEGLAREVMGWGMGCAAGDDGSVNGIEVSPRDGGDS